MVNFALSLLSLALLAICAFSLPPHEASAATRREQRREDAALVDLPASIEGFVGSNIADITGGNVSDVVYISDFAGAMYLNYPPGTFTSVKGTFVVPTLRAPPGATGTYFDASATVSIDAGGCSSAALSAGLEMVISNGQVTYTAWYRWYPADMVRITSISVSAGHTLQLTVSATGTRSGTVTIYNLSTGQIFGQGITSVAALCQQSAVWRVEDFVYATGAFVALANFGTVAFTDAEAGIGLGVVGPGGATIFDIFQNQKVLTSTSVGTSAITISYVGGK